MSTFEATLEIWNAMEKLFDSGNVKQIGISNIYDYNLLISLFHNVRIKPAVIQNRFDYGHNNFDQEIRKFCKKNMIIYQSFWTLTASNQQMLFITPGYNNIAKFYDLTVEQLFLKFVMNLGIVPLVGTTNRAHMMDDIKLIDFQISEKHQTDISNMLGIVA